MRGGGVCLSTTNICGLHFKAVISHDSPESATVGASLSYHKVITARYEHLLRLLAYDTSYLCAVKVGLVVSC